MPKETDRSEERSFQFQTSPAVAGSRARTHYVNCAVCQTDNSSYLFHKAGVRFVRCRTCGMVYVNPVGSDRTNYFEIGRSGQYPIEQDRQLCL
jgi:ribosomal protein S27E